MTAESNNNKDKATAHGAPRDPTMKAKIHPPLHFLASNVATIILGTISLDGIINSLFGGQPQQEPSARRSTSSFPSSRLQIVSSSSGQHYFALTSLFGIAGFLGAVGLFRSAMLTFQKNETPIPHGYKVKTVVSDGVYGYTRNPIYVAMVGGVASLGVALNTYWGGISALYLMGVIHWFVIPYEEQYMEANFGKVYMEYKDKVPRWFLFA